MTLPHPQFYAVAYEIQGYEPNLDDDLMREGYLDVAE